MTLTKLALSKPVAVVVAGILIAIFGFGQYHGVLYHAFDVGDVMRRIRGHDIAEIFKTLIL